MTTTEERDPAINQASALAKVGGDLDLLTELAGLFCQEKPNMLSALRQAVTDGNAVSARAAAHSLKGSLAVFSPTHATGLAARVEDSAQSGNLTAAADILVELEAEVERVCTALQQLSRQ
jgi:HPt (histidine-containing phosphotransfer) domain-containing protein